MERTSIIVPCFNQRGFTATCITSLLRHTRTSWELIVVDNGSTDDTAAYLAGIQDAAPVPVTIIRNTRNLGFPAAINQGVQLARGEYLVLLNNDAVVTDGWLDQLIAMASARLACSVETAERGPSPPPVLPSPGGETDEAAPTPQGGPRSQGEARQVGWRIGLVGPMSNYAAPPQLVEAVPYRDLEEMQVFARRWRAEHRGQWFTVSQLSGFCLLMKRAVYQAIGGLDPRFGLGFFDDNDLSERARRAGFALAVAHELFRILGLSRPESFCSLDQGIYGHVTRRNLAVLAAERGDGAEAARLWHAVLAECPGDRQATAMLRQLSPKPVDPGC